MISYINNLSSNLPTYTSLPTTRVSPLIIWQRTNGRWIMRWDSGGAVWTPFYGIGDTTVYVSTTGTDSQTNGDGTGSDAFLTLNYAWNNTPHIGDGKITYIVATGTYVTTTTTHFCKKQWIETTIEGEYTVSLTGTVSANTTGHAGTITHTGGGLTTNAHQDMLMVFDDITVGVTYPSFTTAIRSNTTTVFTVEYNPGGLVNASTTYSVVSAGTTFNSSGSTTSVIWYFSSAVKIIKCKFQMHSIRYHQGYNFTPSYVGPSLEYYGYGTVTTNNLYLYIVGCFFEVTYTNYTFIIDAGMLVMFGCNYISSYTTGGPDATFFMLIRFGSYAYVYASRIRQTAGTKVNLGLYAYTGRSRAGIFYSSLNNFSTGLNTAHGGNFAIDQATVTNCTNGVNAQNNGTGNTGTVTYSGNTTNEASATSGVII